MPQINGHGRNPLLLVFVQVMYGLLWHLPAYADLVPMPTSNLFRCAIFQVITCISSLPPAPSAQALDFGAVPHQHCVHLCSVLCKHAIEGIGMATICVERRRIG